jgi:hypothetical protein
MSKNYSRSAYEKYVGQGNNNTTGQYLDMVNQPTGNDGLAEAFFKAGGGPAVGPQQQNSNALLMGIGSGLKGYENNKRAEKTKWLEEQTAGILKLEMQLKSQMQEQQNQQQQLSTFFQQNMPLLSTISQANLHGDKIAADKAAKALFINYKNTIKDPSLGDYMGQEGGRMRYIDNETGDEIGRNLLQFMYQAGIDPVQLVGPDEAKLFMAGLSEGAALNHQKSELMDQYALQGASLKNQGMQTDINYRNAQMRAMETQNNPEYLQSQAMDAKQNMSWKTREKNNTEKLIPEITSQFIQNEEIIPSIDEFKNLLKNTNLAGDSKLAAFKRFVAKETGTNQDVINAQNYGQFYLEWMGRVTKGTISDKDLEEYKSTFARIDTNPKASIEILDRLQKKLQKQNSRFEKQLSIYDQDPGANLSSLDVLSPSRKRINDTDMPEETPQDIVDKALRGEIPLERSRGNNNSNPTNNNFNSIIESLGGERLK